MTRLLSGLAVIVGAVFAVAGLIAGSAVLFSIAAVFSGVAVIALWRSSKPPKERPFHTDAPALVEPDWDRPLRVQTAKADALAHAVPDVLVDRYDEKVAAEILASLGTMSVEQLRDVILREKAGMNRTAVIERAQTLIDQTVGTSPASRSRSASADSGTVRTTTRRRAASGTTTRRSGAERKTPAAERKTSTRKTTRSREATKKDGPELGL
jgi:hypothetical protein